MELNDACFGAVKIIPSVHLAQNCIGRQGLMPNNRKSKRNVFQANVSFVYFVVEDGAKVFHFIPTPI